MSLFIKPIKYIRMPHSFILVLALSVFWSSCANDISQGQEPTSQQLAYFTQNGFGNPVSAIQQPAGEHYKGVTYLTYQGLLEDPYVAAYNHSTRQWAGPFKAGVSDMGKDPTREKKIDNHGKPAMIVDDEGYIHLVFGGHGGLPEHGKNTLGNYHYGRMKHVVSKRPLDITSWESLDNIPPFGTYTQWIKMNNGDIYLFYRHGAHRSNWVYQKSTDNARSFGAPVSILKTKQTTGARGRDAWYAHFSKADENTIVANINFHMCWDNYKNKTHTGERRNGYYLYMNTHDEKWRNVKGESLATPVTKALADEKALVLDSGELWTNIGDVALDPNGHPHMTFRMGQHMGLKHGGPQKLYYLRWDGANWRGGDATDLPVSRGEIKLYSAKDISLWLAGKAEQGKSELAIWKSRDAGKNFEKAKTVLSLPRSGIGISSFIRNAHPDAQVLVAEKAPGTDLRRMYLVGEKGPIYRPAKDLK